MNISAPRDETLRMKMKWFQKCFRHIFWFTRYIVSEDTVIGKVVKQTGIQHPSNAFGISRAIIILNRGETLAMSNRCKIKCYV